MTFDYASSVLPQQNDELVRDGIRYRLGFDLRDVDAKPEYVDR